MCVLPPIFFLSKPWILRLIANFSASLTDRSVLSSFVLWVWKSWIVWLAMPTFVAQMQAKPDCTTPLPHLLVMSFEFCVKSVTNFYHWMMSLIIWSLLACDLWQGVLHLVRNNIAHICLSIFIVIEWCRFLPTPFYYSNYQWILFCVESGFLSHNNVCVCLSIRIRMTSQLLLQLSIDFILRWICNKIPIT